MTLSFIRGVIPLSLAEYLIHITQLKYMNKQGIKCMNIFEGGRKKISILKKSTQRRGSRGVLWLHIQSVAYNQEQRGAERSARRK